MREFVLGVPDENMPIGDVYYPDERDAAMPVGEEIVRCRDCKHWDDLTMYSDVGVCTRPCGDPNIDEGAWAKPNDFCSWGERREDA